MSRCLTCHPEISGRVVGPRQTAGAFRVGAAFSHTKHGARMASVDAVARCLACHEAVTRVGNDDLPGRPVASRHKVHTAQLSKGLASTSSSGESSG